MNIFQFNRPDRFDDHRDMIKRLKIFSCLNLMEQIHVIFKICLSFFFKG
ncbi:hypothetical protein P689_119127 [Candidatus Riesia pediculischaeffi PTSU]|uniref:Uncharacterized protein n=1 Tax=Candidatus Riesia pediculischaeffi PTSU TaxID=1401651 RepID=A0A0C1SA43_9ENTR|nr:hypothetical protein P689_119127 [Candidatus Riesia pediculischaeffi PTSU]